MDDKKTADSSISAVVKTFKVIETLSSRQSWDLARLTSAVDMPKTTVHRILLTLINIGYVEQCETSGKYRCTFRFLNLGSRIVDSNSVVMAAQPFMDELESITNENINLCIPDGDCLVIVSKRESTYSLKPSQPLGQRLPLHGSANGRAFLSHARECIQKKVISGLRSTGAVGDIQSFIDLLESIRKEGVAMEIEEHIKGVGCIAAPILDHENQPVGTLGIATPTVRLTDEMIKEFRRLAVTKAHALSKLLGAK
ncbi:IclR family transcriptional regulator [Rhodobacteraceae bacterium RKSG542]|uniref:IclR family transcriptional regulator n=1 Tax=Pseudovibrio flavus TaxID=2529854 RepID=UPI0012BCC1A0|nr:IclR family transcriptional regulator [Pseudovibrio flavus]MTI15957.1 IclR family transcriptional regulator [Pseudovibrio flavus]